MCGIGAVVGRADDPTVPVDRIEATLRALSGRGPDGGWYDASPGAVLVATRLIQWDEGTPRQPYVTERGDRAVFNGELFNLTELQRYVALPGAPEIAVLLEGLRRWGPTFLTRIDGQFAVVARLADGTTYAARDRFGICPLFWGRGQDDGDLVVGSSVAAVAILQGTYRPAYDVAGLATILRDWAPTGTSTPYAGIAQVPPGHIIVVNPGATGERAERLERWADAAVPSAAAAIGPDGGDLETRLRTAVQVRMRSVAEVACLVSGGIDSTVIAAMAHEEGARLGLSLWLDGDDVARERQQEVAAATGLDLVQHRLTAAETMATFRKYVATRRLPLVRLGPVGMTALARRARAEGVRTVLSGEGADEVFCGYDSYRLIAARAGLFGPVDALDWARFGAPEMPVGRSARAHRAYWRGLIALGAQSPARVAILRPVADMFGPVLTEAMALAESPGKPSADKLAAAAGASSSASSLLRSRRREDLDTLLAAYLLVVQGDYAWLEEGIELRPPYLAAIVADWALARDPAEFVSVERGKLPIYGLLDRLARRRPALAGLGFAKSAFRVDARLLLGDATAYDDFRAAVAACPDELISAAAVLDRLDRGRRAGTLAEAESMIATLAASFGILATT